VTNLRGFGILLCIIGAFVAAGGIIAYFSDSEGAGIAGMVIGGCFLGIGVTVFLNDFILRLTRRSAKLTIRFEFFKMKMLIQGEIGSPESEGEWLEEGIEEPRLSRWAE